MTQTLKVKFQNGTFHPVDDVPPATFEGQDGFVTLEWEEVEAEIKPHPFVFGLHAGMGWVSDDFDEELPDSFWLGEE